VFALDCAPTHDVACHRAEDSGELSVGHATHEVTSVAAQVGVSGSLIAGVLVLGLRRVAHASLKRGNRFVVVLAVVHVLALAIMLLAIGASGVGYPQAVLVATASLWFAVVGLGVLDH
jgi:hypothetical protein